eukprot:TRINITY_DN3940_c0_g1_i1.p1 TRINITY_DN3940_c0_g1~~TRINITY_DN3940_c0_g1_i1.p1  ORF type:complete len:202 (-),score=123.60 TRINITY_DN3940_c0_g1_i1:20-598(-)
MSIQALDPKLFGALLNASFKLIFEKDTTINPQMLKDELFADSEDITVDHVKVIFEKVARMILEGAKKNWDLPTLETKLKDSPLSDAQQEIFIRFWKQRKPEIFESMLRQSKWNDSLLQFRWRLDVITKTKGHDSNINQPTAIIELTTGLSGSPVDAETNEVVRFEVERNQLAEIISKVESIEARLLAISSSQ